MKSRKECDIPQATRRSVAANALSKKCYDNDEGQDKSVFGKGLGPQC